MVRKYNKRGKRTDYDLIELASSVNLRWQSLALNGTGDTLVGTVLHDCEFIGGHVIVSADEGTNGDLTIEKWDSATGGVYKTTISATVAIDAGAASNEPIAAVTTADRYLTAGDVVVIDLGTATGNAVTGTFTLWFREIEFIGP